MGFESYEDNQLIGAYCDILDELRKRKIIRSKNVTGDLGEFYTIECYHKNKNFPNLALQTANMQNIDAVSVKGSFRYSIKATTGISTGVIRTSTTPENPEEPRKIFDFLVVVQFDEHYRLRAVYEISWDVFLKYRKWHKTMNAWNIQLTKQVVSESKLVYPIIPEKNRGLTDYC